MIMIYYRVKKFKKGLHFLEADIITIKNIDLMFLVERMYFFQNVLQIPAIALVSVINHYHINGLHLETTCILSHPVHICEFFSE